MTRISLEKQPEIVTIEDFCATYPTALKDGVLNIHCSNSVDFLSDKGLLPLKYTSPLFPNFNLLVNVVLWSGSVGMGTQNRPFIQISDGYANKLEKLLGDGIGDLDVEINAKSLGQNGSAYSRLMYCLPGIFHSDGKNILRQRKSEGMNLPDYLLFLSNQYKNFRGDDRAIARKVIGDTIATLLNRKLTFGPDGLPQKIDLFGTQIKEDGIEFGKSVIGLFNAIYPKIELNESSIKTPSMKSSSYSHDGYMCNIGLSLGNIIDMHKYGIINLRADLPQDLRTKEHPIRYIRS